MQQRLSVYIGERSERVGTLVYDPARPSVSQFCYADSWLSQPNGFAVSPELPLLSQWFFLNDAERNSPFPFAFADTEPDSWGRRLIKRSFRKAGHSRGLSEIDFLLGVDDFSRIGALRFALEGCQPGESKDGRRRTPPLLDLGKIARSSRRFELDEATDDDLDYLEGKGTSLGGARPKCTVLDEHGNLAIGKFASVNDERSVVKGEILGLELARAAGLNAAVGQIVTVDGVNVAVVKRFDRTRLGRRIPYWSMATFLQCTDNGYPPPSYQLLNEKLFLQADRSDKSPAKELFGRLLLNFLINNTDDHGRNTGLLMQNNGAWVLSPAFDINPVPLSRPDAPYLSKCYLSSEEGEMEDVRQLWKCRPAFDLSEDDGIEVFRRVITAVQNWKTIAVRPKVRMNASDLRDYASAFSPVRLQKALDIVA